MVSHFVIGTVYKHYQKDNGLREKLQTCKIKALKVLMWHLSREPM